MDNPFITARPTTISMVPTTTVGRSESSSRMRFELVTGASPDANKATLGTHFELGLQQKPRLPGTFLLSPVHYQRENDTSWNQDFAFREGQIRKDKNLPILSRRTSVGRRMMFRSRDFLLSKSHFVSRRLPFLARRGERSVCPFAFLSSVLAGLQLACGGAPSQISTFLPVKFRSFLAFLLSSEQPVNGQQLKWWEVPENLRA